MSNSGDKKKLKLADYLKQIFNSHTKEVATAITPMIAQRCEESYHKTNQVLQYLKFTLTYLYYPTHHQHKVRTASLIEGAINKDLKQSSEMIGIFHKQGTCPCYVSLRIIEIEKES